MGELSDSDGLYAREEKEMKTKQGWMDSISDDSRKKDSK